MDSIDDGLKALLTRGFRFRSHTDLAGEIVSVEGSYQWWQFSDCIQLFAENSAIAVRLVHALPGMAVWSHEGDAASTMTALLRLPGPHEPHAPWHVHPAPSPLRLPH